MCNVHVTQTCWHKEKYRIHCPLGRLIDYHSCLWHATASHIRGHDGRKEKGTAWHLELTSQWQSRCLCVAAKRLPAAPWLFFCSWFCWVRNWGKVQQMASTLLFRNCSSEQGEDMLKTQSWNRIKTQSQFLSCRSLKRFSSKPDPAG